LDLNNLFNQKPKLTSSILAQSMQRKTMWDVYFCHKLIISGIIIPKQTAATSIYSATLHSFQQQLVAQ
jgi:hypothetical protein